MDARSTSKSTNTVEPGCETSSPQTSSVPAMSSETSSMYDRATSIDTIRSTPSPALASGQDHCETQESGTPITSGPDRALANLSARQAKEKDTRMNDIFGQHGFDLSEPVGPHSSSENRSRPRTDSDGYLVRMRHCRVCGVEKTYDEFYVNSKGQRRQTCKSCVTAQERERKRQNKECVSKSHKDWREKKRGFALVNMARYRARLKGIPFDLDPLDIQARIDRGTCEVTGLPFNLEGGKTWDSP